jgi:hypothetical protein
MLDFVLDRQLIYSEKVVVVVVVVKKKAFVIVRKFIFQ